MPYNPSFRVTDSSTWTCRWPPPDDDSDDPGLDDDTYINFLEAVPSSPQEELRNDGSQAVRTVWVDWVDRFFASYVFCGWPTIATNLANGRQYISRNLPMPHQDFLVDDNPGAYFLWCDQVQKCEGHGVPDPAPADIPIAEMAADVAEAFTDPPLVTLEQAACNAGQTEIQLGSPDFAEMLNPQTQVPVYQYAKLTLLFKSYVYEVVPDDLMPTDENDNPDESTLARYVTIKTTSGDQYLTLPTGGFDYVNAAGNNLGVVPGQPGIVVPQDTVTLTWYLVPERAIGKKLINPPPYFKHYPLDSYRGTVNISTFLGQPPGCVLFLSGNCEPFVSAFGNILYTVTLTFRVFNPGLDSDGRPIGHNHLFAIASTGSPTRRAGYYEVVNGNTGTATNIMIEGPVGDQVNIGIADEVGSPYPVVFDNVNIFNWREHRDLMRIPELGP